jgi:cell division protein FtsW (lipid II flippase)
MTIEKSKLQVMICNIIICIQYLSSATNDQRFSFSENDQSRWLRVEKFILFEISKVRFFFVFSRVYLATKKNDENKTKYAIKVINKQDIRKKNLTDQSNEKKNRIYSFLIIEFL